MNYNLNNQGAELIKEGVKDMPAWVKVLLGLAILGGSVWVSYDLINHKAKKQQEINKKKSDFRKEESAQNSAQRIQESIPVFATSYYSIFCA